MALWQGKSRRKPSGGRLIRHRGKRRFEIGRETQVPTIGEEKRTVDRIRGGNQRTRVVRAKVANVTDTSDGATEQAEIESVVENPANIHYVRRNLITKGAILQTEKGRARVTSRPGQDGVINAVLLD